MPRGVINFFSRGGSTPLAPPLLTYELDPKLFNDILSHRQIKYPVNFDNELEIGHVRYDKMT